MIFENKPNQTNPIRVLKSCCFMLKLQVDRGESSPLLCKPNIRGDE